MLKMAIKMCDFEAQNNKRKNYTSKEEQIFALFSAVKVCPTQLSSSPPFSASTVMGPDLLCLMCML